ncbi:hypothetical protein ABZ840_08235 [Streptomyces sp. NPDC047117]|uniref:hypothetical protein n=1 Tax=Streptomyces sp. NPDC047117 TaxID=3155379 RepID=UPI0033C06B6A
MHAFAEAVRYQCGLPTMLSTDGGAQERLIVEGAGTLPERLLAADFGPRVLTDHGVTSSLLVAGPEARELDQLNTFGRHQVLPSPLAPHIGHEGRRHSLGAAPRPRANTPATSRAPFNPASVPLAK